jgi:predicted amidohydrolase YtcJ
MGLSTDITRIAKVLGADTVLRNGKIITVDEEDSVAESLAVKYGRIAWVGPDEGVESFIGEETEIVDLGGRCLTPGLITTHEHFLRYGLNALFGIDLWYPNVKSIAAIVEAVREKASDIPKGDWILGYGWDENLIAEKRYPNRWDLDQAAPDNPVYLGRVYQMVAANSLALEIAGVTKDTPDRVWEDPSGRVR